MHNLPLPPTLTRDRSNLRRYRMSMMAERGDHCVATTGHTIAEDAIRLQHKDLGGVAK